MSRRSTTFPRVAWSSASVAAGCPGTTRASTFRKAWTQERFSHQGKYFQFQDVCVMPKPFQKPHPPIRIAATTQETYPLVGRMGAPVFVAVRTVSLTDLKRHLPSYQEAWTAAGHPGRGDVGVSMPLYVAETARQARDRKSTRLNSSHL